MNANKAQGDAFDTSACAAYIKGNVFPICPASGVYTYNPVGTDAACGITEHKL